MTLRFWRRLDGINVYEYFLRNRVSGQVVELGSTAELSDFDALLNGIVSGEWFESWELCYRIKAEGDS